VATPQAAVLCGTAYATPNERAVIALRWEPQECLTLLHHLKISIENAMIIIDNTTILYYIILYYMIFIRIFICMIQERGNVEGFKTSPVTAFAGLPGGLCFGGPWYLTGRLAELLRPNAAPGVQGLAVDGMVRCWRIS
jgi:hypothetical protein